MGKCDGLYLRYVFVQYEILVFLTDAEEVEENRCQGVHHDIFKSDAEGRRADGADRDKVAWCVDALWDDSHKKSAAGKIG